MSGFIVKENKFCYNTCKVVDDSTNIGESLSPQEGFSLGGGVFVGLFENQRFEELTRLILDLDLVELKR